MILQPIILLTTHAPGTSRMGPRSAAASFPHARDSRRFRFYDESGGATERSFASIEPEPRGLEEDSPDVRKKSPMPIFAGTSSDQELESPVVFLLTLQYMPRFTVQRPGTDAPRGSRWRWVRRAGRTVAGRALLDYLADPVGLGLKPPWGGREELDEEDPHVGTPASRQGRRQKAETSSSPEDREARCWQPKKT